MSSTPPQTLSSKDAELWAATRPRQLERMSEEELVELHGRVRKARNKYRKLHRRQSRSAQRRRGWRNPEATRTSEQAELFEDMLAVVSEHLAVAAKRAAADLRRERLAAAQGPPRATPGGTPHAPGAGKLKGPHRASGRFRAQRRPVDTKIAAAGRAAGQRNQAKRDSRGR